MTTATDFAQLQADVVLLQARVVMLKADLDTVTASVTASSSAAAKLTTDYNAAVSELTATTAALAQVATDLGGVVPPPPPPPPPGTVGFGQTAMGVPTFGSKAYAAGDRVLHDAFAGTILDKTLWWPRKGAGSVWDNFGSLACPYTGSNLPLGNDQDEGQLENPSQIVVNNGLTINVVPNPNKSGPMAPYISLSGAMTSYSQNLGDCTGSTARNALPTGGWMIEILAKEPDMQHGCFGSFWVLGTGGGSEIDIAQGCFGVQYASGAAINRYPMACGPVSGGQAIPDVGVDATLAFHRYSCEWIPSKSIKCFFDGKQVGPTWTGGAVAGPMAYEVLLHAATWIQGLGFATGYAGGTYAFQVAEFAAYKF